MLLMPIHLKELGVAFEAEYKFCPTRKWRADFAVPAHKILIEIDGGAYVGGRHTSGFGFEKDLEKMNMAQFLRYRVFRFLPKHVLRGEAKAYLRDVLELS
jgi:very-short-patch-repair endonuclease